jgi:hypothetical protein
VDRERPWCVVRRSTVGGYSVKFGCDDTEHFLGLVRSFKSRVDWRGRRFDPQDKVWYLTRAAGDDLRLWLLAHFEAVQRRLVGLELDDLLDDEASQTPPPPPPPPRSPPGRGPASPYDVLWLRPGAPPELVRAAYRALAQLHHPDRGGDHETMVAINRAFDALQRGAA